MGKDNGGKLDPAQENKRLESLAEAVAASQELATAGMEERPSITQSMANSVFKQVEAIAERAVMEQVEPLRKLRKAAEEMETLQFEHLARFKVEAQTMFANGARMAEVAKLMETEIQKLRSEHANIINAKVAT